MQYFVISSPFTYTIGLAINNFFLATSSSLTTFAALVEEEEEENREQKVPVLKILPLKTLKLCA